MLNNKALKPWVSAGLFPPIFVAMDKTTKSPKGKISVQLSVANKSEGDANQNISMTPFQHPFAQIINILGFPIAHFKTADFHPKRIDDG